jgi:DNA-binding NtrC family response regulator
MLEAINNGDFREDLYFRLNVVNLKLPPLRNRPLDIIPLAQYFVTKFCDLNGLAKKSFSNSSIHALQKYSWRGNVRELENIMHRAVLLSNETIEPNDIFGYEIDQSVHTTTVQELTYQDYKNNPLLNLESENFNSKTIAEMEREMILNTLKKCLGNRTHAANILGISIRTLRNKIKEYNTCLEIEEEKSKPTMSKNPYTEQQKIL